MYKYIAVLIISLFILAGCGKGVSYTPPENISRPIKGNAEASIVVEEFSDFQCPACKSAVPIVERLLSQYGDRVQVQYRHFPLDQIHKRAFAAARSSECANDQGKFWEMHDALFANQPDFSKDELIQYARDIELDAELFTTCFESSAHGKTVRSDQADGRKKGVSGTPTFFVNGKKVQNYGNLLQEVAAVLEKEAQDTE